MSGASVKYRFREFFEYNLKPAWDLFRQGEFAFLAGAIVEELTGRNPYFWYLKRRNKDQFVLRDVREHEMWIDLYDRGISRRLLIRGIHEAEVTEVYGAALDELRSEVDGEITVLDIGGNIGYYVLEEANVLGDRASIIAFEPDPGNRELLERNAKHNGYLDVVDISPKAIDETSGKRTFCRSTHSNWNRLERETETGNADELVERFSVETTSVDEFLVENQIDPREVNAVRMDLEGHELNVLRGMTDVLSAEGPLVLFVEFHPDFVDRSEYEEAIKTIEGHGFSVRSASQKWNMLDIDSVGELQSVAGSHVGVVLSRGL